MSKPEFDDCSLVLTTSRGQVTMAPAVPPTLENISVLERVKRVDVSVRE